MIFVKTFKGYEDKPADLDAMVNQWIREYRVDVRGINSVLSHEVDGRSGSGDLLYTVLYSAEQPVD